MVDGIVMNAARDMVDGIVVNCSMGVVVNCGLGVVVFLCRYDRVVCDE